MPDRRAYESALLTHAPSGWDENDIGIAADDLEGDWDDLDRDLIAHSLWQMGAGLDHSGCRYGGTEPDDADYENNCSTCREHLLGVADAVLSEMATGSAGREATDG
ncbi:MULTISPECIES: hypothetical protein [unclassified Microbacterium]|uniref:hypothetical protein n=1 Tax=unclassified Microbacterium TaxID=2609290 RepID=UPI0030186D5F